MAQNIVFNHINKLNELFNQFCSTTDEHVFTISPEFGKGVINRYSRPNWDLYIGHFKLTQDLRIQRFPEPENHGEYGISFQTVKDDIDAKEWKNPELKKASEGLIFNSHNSPINTMWHRNTECSFVHWSFNLAWIKEIENNFNFPSIIGNMLAERENPMFHVPLSAEMRHNIRQLLYLPTEVHGDFTPSYLYGKCIELFTQASGLMVQRVYNKDKKQNIHPDDFNLLEQVKIQLINNYQTPPSIVELVEQTGMSKSKLQRLFNAEYKTSVYQFVKSIRMEKAMELLMQGHSVTEAGYDVGYSSIPNFSAAFKEHFNQLPGQVQSR